MGSMQINFAEVEGGFDAIPKGLYPVTIEKVEVRESKSSDNDYLNWEMVINEGDHEGRRLWQITSLSEKALFRLKDQFAELDVMPDDEMMDLEWDEDIEITPSSGPLLLNPDVSGLSAMAVVTIDMYEGKEVNRVDELRSPSAREKAPGQSAKAGNSSGATAAKTSGSRRALR